MIVHDAATAVIQLADAVLAVLPATETVTAADGA